MPSRLRGQLKRLLQTAGRYFLRRLEQPIPFYEQRIINNLTSRYGQIRIIGVGVFDYRSIWAEKRA